MIRLLRTVGTIIGYAAFVTPQLKNVKQTLELYDTVAEKDIVTNQYAKKWASKVLKTAGVKVNVTGSQQFKDTGVLFVANHEGNFDIPVLLYAVNKPFGFVSKVEVKKIPFLHQWMDILNCIYLDRTDRRSSIQMIRDGVNALKAGHSIMIFPEGTRSKGKGMSEFKAGSFKLAKSAGVPIVPIAIEGTSKIMEKYDSKKIVPGEVQVHILDAIDPEIFDRYTLQEVANIVHQRIEERLVTNK
ncbi:lysophospholipid acyltransferase family protein [Macrococcoides caseolyticum]|uniref:lysophospholipid acyltransferase family protein n=1 Tax=Macrococcoides caseolyticum TaxID=69966 RepID=UPI001F3B60EB|nr:lysophospholipid acyltransferase family protein [Macrococcus caseolyticus]MCE4957023.1 1-acyl-sn-glycerol-3-phosphate acyltransferase [Macrococcus caseolyticus]